MTVRKLTLEVQCKIINRLTEGRSLRSICSDIDIPVTPAAVRKLAAHSTAFGTQYVRARDLGLEAIVDEILEIADDARGDWVEVMGKDGMPKWKLNHENIQRSRLRCDVRKWYLSKLAPKKYGDRMTQGVTSSDGTLKTMSQEQIALRLQQILDAAQKRALSAKLLTA